jgi:hypothetical protein
MDTPRPDQIRTAQPQAEAATEEDSMELMEMILGALGEYGSLDAAKCKNAAFE